MTQLPQPSLVAIPKIGVVEKSRWWTSAIRRHFHSWQLQVAEFNDVSLITPEACQRHQLWILDLKFEDKVSAQLIELFQAQDKLFDSLIILPESRAHLLCRFVEIGVRTVVINPYHEEELIKWIELNVVIPEIRVLQQDD